MREVLPNVLWIGAAGAARDVKSVMSAGIRAVIDLAIEEPPILLPREIIYCRFPLLDGDGNPAALLQSSIDTTARLVAADIPTLVACSGGMSRSPAIASAAIAKTQSLGLAEALEHIAARGPCDVSPALWNDIKAIVASEL